jgi:hypothetical protein
VIEFAQPDRLGPAPVAELCAAGCPSVTRPVPLRHGDNDEASSIQWYQGDRGGTRLPARAPGHGQDLDWSNPNAHPGQGLERRVGRPQVSRPLLDCADPLNADLFVIRALGIDRSPLTLVGALPGRVHEIPSSTVCTYSRNHTLKTYTCKHI